MPTNISADTVVGQLYFTPNQQVSATLSAVGVQKFEYCRQTGISAYFGLRLSASDETASKCGMLYGLVNYRGSNAGYTDDVHVLINGVLRHLHGFADHTNYDDGYLCLTYNHTTSAYSRHAESTVQAGMSTFMPGQQNRLLCRVDPAQLGATPITSVMVNQFMPGMGWVPGGYTGPLQVVVFTRDDLETLGDEALYHQVGMEPYNHAPVIDVSVDYLYGGSASRLIISPRLLSVYDADGDAVTVMVDFGDGTAPSPLAVYDPGLGDSLGHAYLTPGLKTLTFTATDARGATTVATRQITAINTPPWVTIDGYRNTGTTGYLHVTAQDADMGYPFAVFIDWGDGAGYVLVAGTYPVVAITELAMQVHQEFSHTYAAPGTYGVRVKVVDSANEYAVAEMQVVAGEPPVCSYATKLSADYRAVTIYPAFSDPDGTVVSWRYCPDSVNASTQWVDGVLGQPAVYTYTESGTYDLAVEVTDNTGLTTVQHTLIDATSPCYPSAMRRSAYLPGGPREMFVAVGPAPVIARHPYHTTARRVLVLHHMTDATAGGRLSLDCGDLSGYVGGPEMKTASYSAVIEDFPPDGTLTLNISDGVHTVWLREI